MSPLPKEQARVTFCTTPTSPTANSSSKPPLQVPVTINLIHGDIVQGATRAVPILRNSESSSNNGGARMRNKSESSKLGDQEDLKRLTAELEVVPFDQNNGDVKKHKITILYMSIGGAHILWCW